MIDRATVQKIKDTADIVDVVGDYVSLTRRGANYMGLCPFHNERTPSFSVNKARNFCYCFSCHKGGSPINFIMEKEGISYHDALLQLAKKYGIKVEEHELTDEEKQLMSLREGMFVANEWAMNYFENTLFDTEEGKDIGLSYIYGKRGVTQEAIKSFHLGYAPENQSDFIESAVKKGFNKETLRTLGLTGISQRGNEYARFSGRVIFPVQNVAGKVVAFGGRDLKGSHAKYINSPESEIYKKSNELYGIYQAKTAIIKEDRCYLVEGYLDVISMWQAGVKNVVASSGTALTDGQISLIHRFTKNVTLIYDGDAAGIKASLRGIDMLLSHQLDLKVLLLPDGEDPDSFSRKLSPEEFKKYIADNETDIIRFKAKLLADESGNDTQKRIEAIKSVVTSLAHIPDKIKRDIYSQECCRIFGVSEESLIGDIARIREQILNNEKVKRRREELEVSLKDNNNPTVVASPENNTTGKNESDKIKFGFNQLWRLEWGLLEYCLKYGFMTLWEETDDLGNNKEISTLDYVLDELSLDGITFSDPELSHTLEVLKNMIPQFLSDYTSFKQQLLIKCDEKREEEYRHRADSATSIEMMQQEDKIIEAGVAEWYNKELQDFTVNYGVKELTSHEDEIVRKHANQAFTQRHRLSNIYTRDGNRVETEEDKVLQLVTNAINLLKNGQLDLELKKLLDSLKGLSEDDIDKIQEINSRVAYILQTRSRMAKDIGDRIISPRKKY